MNLAPLNDIDSAIFQTIRTEIIRMYRYDLQPDIKEQAETLNFTLPVLVATVGRSIRDLLVAGQNGEMTEPSTWRRLAASCGYEVQSTAYAEPGYYEVTDGSVQLLYSDFLTGVNESKAICYCIVSHKMNTFPGLDRPNMWQKSLVERFVVMSLIEPMQTHNMNVSAC